MTKKHSKQVASLLEKMTVDEKLGQMGSFWMYELQTRGELDMQKVGQKMKHGLGQITRLAGASTLDPINAARTANRIQKFLVENTRLGIPAIIHEECCLGAMILGGTMYPQIIGLASTFRPELAEKMTHEIKRQLRAIGVHQGLSPVLDVARDGRWGRVEETFGEDPLLAAHFGMSYIRGLQGDDLKDGVMATGKHFVGHSLSQGGLNCNPVHIAERDLWDVFLMPFQAAIRDAGLASIMNAYPELNGEVVAASRRILTDILRTKLGFDGLVVSDYLAIDMIHDFHRVTEDKTEAARLALEAGIDVECPNHNFYNEILKAGIDKGVIKMDLVDEAVRRHLTKKFELGLFENPYVDEGRVCEVFETSEQRSLARDIARQSIVLLSNNGILPLKKNLATLAVIGPNADNGRNLLGDYSYHSMMNLMIHNQIEDSSFYNIDAAQIEEHQVKVPSVLKTIQAKCPQTRILYAKGSDNKSNDFSRFQEAIGAAENADAVVLVLGDVSGLAPEGTCGEFRDSSDLKLPGVQSNLANAILATGKPVVIVLVNGRPLAIPDLAQKAAAVIEAWLPGEEGGAAITDVLFGDTNPGGKLPITFPRSVGQVPVYYNHKPSGGKSHWYGDYVNESVEPLFPFGHGLSYTQFEYAGLAMSRKQAGRGEIVEISCSVKNSGNRAGDEVAQLYVCDTYASTPRPVKELKGYVRLTLQPGETRLVTFKLPVNMLAFHDENLDLVLEPGGVEIMIGSSSEDIRLKGAFEITGAAKMPVQERIFACQVEVR